MNDRGEPVAAVRNDSAGIAWSQVIAILAAAVALGLVYNAGSPLGVRAPKAGSQVAVLPVKSNAVVAASNPAPSAPTSVHSTTNNPAFTVRWIEIKAQVEAGQIVLVDGRPRTAFDIEHIPGAVSLPAEGMPEAFIDFATKHPPNTAIVVYCSSENCDAAHELAEKLRSEFGYSNVKEMPGGVVEYRMAESGTNPANSK